MYSRPYIKYTVDYRIDHSKLTSNQLNYHLIKWIKGLQYNKPILIQIGVHTHPHIYTQRRTWLQTTFRSLTINQGNWQPCCAATPGLLISQPASVTTASALMSSALPVGRGGGGVGEQWVGDRETKYGEREREEEGRRNGVLPPLRHTHASQSNSSRARTEHPSILLLRKTRLPFQLLKPRVLLNTIKAEQIHCTSASGERVRPQTRELGVKTDGPISTSDSDHGSNGGGRSSARWVQTVFDSARSSCGLNVVALSRVIHYMWLSFNGSQ